MEAWQFTPYLMAYVAASAISLFLAFISWNLKPINGSKVLGAVLFAICLWMSAYTVQILSTNLNVKLFFIRFEFLGLISSVYLWFIFVIHYTDYRAFKKPWVYLSLAIIPLITYVQILTIDQHEFFYKNISIEKIKGVFMISKTYSVGFYIWAGYAYFLLIASLFLVLYKAISMPKLYRKQILPVAIAVASLIIPNTLHITDNNPIHPFDPTGIAFVAVAIVVLYSLNVQRFLNVVPVAHDIVFKNAKMGILILNDQDRIIDMNPASLRIFERKKRDCMGKKITDILHEFNELRESLQAKSEPIIEVNLGQKNITYEIKVASLRKNGSKRYGSIIMLWDISELKSALYELDAYAHTVAHDLKTPIGNMMGYADLIRNIPKDDPEQDKMLDNIVKSGHKMTDIIDELLKLAEIRSIDPNQVKTIELQPLIQGVLQRILPNDMVDNIVIQPNRWPEILGNHIWVEEIWVNLVSNAYKYGGNPPVIEIGWTTHNSYYHFFVKDNGQGITPDEIQKLFTQYSRLTKHQNKIAGHGLGLSIVHRIVKKMGGKIWVKSKPEMGSTFYFSIPK